jgi:hypothetical protein
MPTVAFLSLKQFKEWIKSTEKLITRQRQLFATTVEPIQIDHTFVLKTNTRIKIICRIDDNRLGITTDLHGTTTQAIISEELVRDIHLEK